MRWPNRIEMDEAASLTCPVLDLRLFRAPIASIVGRFTELPFPLAGEGQGGASQASPHREGGPSLPFSASGERTAIGAVILHRLLN